MAIRDRRSLYYLVLVAVTTLVFTGSYNLGMAIWENQPQPWYHSLEVVIQSFTTTGYGEDAPWQSPQMHILVILMQFSGIGLILTAVDVFAVPWLRETLTPSAPESVRPIEDHIVIVGHTPRTEPFISALRSRDREYVIIDSDPETARELHEADFHVIHGNPEMTETLRNAHLDSAAAVVVDAPEERGASIALSVREMHPEVRLITLIEDARLAQYHNAAGVDEVLSPRQLLGKNLAAEVPTAVKTAIGEGVVIGDDFELVELRVTEDGELAHQTFAEAVLHDKFGVNVIGAWFGSDFKTPVEPDDELDPGTRVLVAGESTQVNALREALTSTVREFSSQRMVIAGYGDSGQAAYEALSDSGSQLTVLDIKEKEQVDVVGDASDPAILKEADINNLDALVLTVASDTTAIFTTLIAHELNPDLRVIVRANQESDVDKLYQAGADYVQSLATVSGRMLASTVFEHETVLTYDTRVNIVRLPAEGLEGTSIVAKDVRSVTGGTVVAVIRNGETITEFDPQKFIFEAEDEVVIAGTDQAITRFEEQFSNGS